MGMVTGFIGTSAVGAIELAASILVRGAILLAVAFALVLVLRGARSAVRHHVWVLAVAGLIALPLLVVGAPDWRIGIPGVAVVAELVAGSPTAERTPAYGAAGGHSVDDIGARDDFGASVPPARRDADSPQAGSAGKSAVTVGAAENPTGELLRSWGQFALLGWAAGLFLLGGRLLVGILRAARLVHRAAPVTDRRWNLLVSRLSLRTGLVSGVRVVSSDEIDVPMAWGIFSSWLVLPQGIESWPDERRRVVVLHELAHLKRRDCLTQAVAQLALAIHWLNPLAWLAVRRMRTEREKACDDEVLAAGVGGPAYAHHLVDIARGLTRRPQPARAAVAMARPSELENRVLAILDGRRDRGGLGRAAWRGGLPALIALLVPVAMLEPAPPERGDAARGEEVELTTAVEGAVDDAFGDDLRFSAPEVESAVDGNVESEAEKNAGAKDAAAADGGSSDEPSATEATDATLPFPIDLQQDTIEERVFRALEKALGSEDPKVRRRVAHTFGTIESPRGVEPLSAVLRNDPDAGVRAEAAWGLGMIESDEGVDVLAVALDDTDANVRRQAVWALGMIESARGVPPLLPLLEEGNSEIRKGVAWALGMIESDTAVDGLASAFASEDEADVRREIVWALGMIEDREATETLIDALEDPDAGVREKALWALGMVMG